MFSMGDWFWNSSKTIVIPQYDSLEYTFDAKGVHVGDAAQTALSATLRYEPIKNISTGIIRILIPFPCKAQMVEENLG